MDLSFGFSQPPLEPPRPPGPPGPLGTPGPLPFGCLCKDRLKIAPQFHYGSTACFSCRAFFRRAHQKKRSARFQMFESGYETRGCANRTVAINELLCMKNAGAQIAMDFS